MRKNPVFASSGATKNSLHSGATTTICIVVPLNILHCGATKYGGRRKVSFFASSIESENVCKQKSLELQY